MQGSLNFLSGLLNFAILGVNELADRDLGLIDQAMGRRNILKPIIDRTLEECLKTNGMELERMARSWRCWRRYKVEVGSYSEDSTATE